jgi:hypothetical protein
MLFSVPTADPTDLLTLWHLDEQFLTTVNASMHSALKGAAARVAGEHSRAEFMFQNAARLDTQCRQLQELIHARIDALRVDGKTVIMPIAEILRTRMNG